MKGRDKSTSPVSGQCITEAIIQVLATLVSRCTTVAGWPVSTNHCPSRSAMKTDRWRPPVQPMAIVK